MIETVKEPPALDINQFCIRCDNYQDDLELLKELWDYLKANKKRYSLTHLRFMSEHLINYMKQH